MDGARSWTARAVVLSSLFIALVAGCDSGDSAVDIAGGTASDAREERSTEHRVILGNAILDTLAGRAEFGVVVEPESGDYHFVIRLATGFDFAGGLIMARPDTALPPPGEYSLGAGADSTAAAGAAGFTMYYREGMQRNLRAESGTLTLSTVTDTLITGRFDAILRGMITGMDRAAGEAEVHAVGSFRADGDMNGYVIGL